MRSLLFATLITFGVNSIHAQSTIGLQYYSTGAGENITATFSKKLNKGSVGFGLGGNINQIKQPDDQSNHYYKRLYATKPLHYLNGNFFIQREVFPKLEKINAFIFYDLQVKFSTTRSSFFSVYDYDSTLVVNQPEEGILYRQIIENFGPFTWIENGFGVGFDIQLTNKFSFQQKFGGGMHFIFGDEPLLVKTRPEWEFMYFYNIGITYKIRKAHNKG
jgi:hypothetical protein